MPITDNMIVRVLPAAGDVAIKNVVSNSDFAGVGTPTLVDEGAEKAWSITTGSLMSVLVPTKTVTSGVAGSGATVAARFKQTANGSGADFMNMFGIMKAAQGVGASVRIDRNGNSSYRGRVRGQSGDLPAATLDSTLTNGSIYTVVFKAEMVGGFIVPKVWRNRVGRVGVDADAIGTNGNPGTTSFDSVFINCQNGVAYTLLDLVYWDRELTDTECAAVADDLRSALSSAAETPVSFSGTVNNQSATVGTAFNLNLSSFFAGSLTPFTYSLVAGSLTGTGLSLNTSTGVISGTPSAAGTISGLQVRSTDAGSNTAQTNTFSITVSAAPQVPQGTFTVGTITVTSSTASVPYTYSASDQTSIQYTLNGGTTTFTASNSPQALSGLTANTTYTIQFRAVNAVGNGAWSTGVQFTTNAATTASFTLIGLANNAGVLWSDTGSITVDVYNPSTGALVIRKTGLSSNTSGDVIVSDAAMTSATTYTAVITIGSARGVVSVTTS